MDEDGLQICVICKKIFPDDAGLQRHNDTHHRQPRQFKKNSVEMSTKPFKNNSLTITRISGGGDSAGVKRGTVNQNQNPERKLSAVGSVVASQSINVRRAEMKLKHAAEGKAKVPFRSPPSGQVVLVGGNDDNNTKWQKWVQRDSLTRTMESHPASSNSSSSSDGTIITPSAAERATSAFCSSAAELTPRGRPIGKGQQPSAVGRKNLPQLLPMVPSNGKRPPQGTSNQRSGAAGGKRVGNSSAGGVLDIMSNIGKMKYINQQVQSRAGPKLISLPGGAGVASKTLKKTSSSPANIKQVHVPPYRMTKPPVSAKTTKKIIPRNGHNNALPKPPANRRLPPQLQVESDEMEFEDDMADDDEEETYSPPHLVSQQAMLAAPAKATIAANKNGGKAPPTKTLSGNRFNPINAKKSTVQPVPVPSPSPPSSRNGNSSTAPPPVANKTAGKKPTPPASSNSNKTALTNGTKNKQNSSETSEVVAKKSTPKKVNSHEAKIKKMKAYVPTMPGTNYDMPSLSAIGAYTNKLGQQVWICLVCNEKEKEESSRDMICCDTCEDWYHWGCVGISYSIPEDDPWYCKRCIFQTSSNPRKDFPKLFKTNVPP